MCVSEGSGEQQQQQQQQQEMAWRSADIYAIGFEEIVDLNASNIMAASSENAKAWSAELLKVLSRDRPYVLLTYVQRKYRVKKSFISSHFVDINQVNQLK